MKNVAVCVALIALAAVATATSSASDETSFRKMGWRLVQLHPDMPAIWMDPSTVASLPDQFSHKWGFQDFTYHPEADVGPTARADFSYPDELLREEMVHAMLATSNPDRAFNDLQQLEQFNNRYYTSSTGVQSSEWIRDQLQAIINATGRTDAEVELFTHNNWPQASVIARIHSPDNNPNTVILGAHCDSTAPGMPNGRAPGADDDGSGSVTVMEVFRIVMENGYVPDRMLEFQFYAAEEVGLLGSADMASQYASSGRMVYAMNQLDMNSYNPNGNAAFRIMFDNNFMNRDLTDFLHLLAAEYTSLSVTTGSYGYAASDHASWHRNGYPAAHFKESTSYPYIHTANDHTQYLDKNYMWEFVGPALGFVVELSNGDIPDRYDW